MRKQIRRTLIFVLLASISLTYSGCNDNQLTTIAKNVDRVALLIKDGREVRDELEEQGIIGRDEARAITIGLLKVNTALKTFNSRAKTYADAGGLTPAGKIELKKLASDLAGAAQELISNGTFGVKNPDAQVRINTTIGALKQLTLTIADTVAAIKTKGGQ